MKLIINADDFGLTVNVSRGILEGMMNGVITDTSAIVGTCAFYESAKMALSQGITEMGLHCLLTMGKPILPKEQLKTLVNDEGYFYTREEFLKKEVDLKEVKMELTAQVERFLSTGLKLNHIDTHHCFMNKSKEMADLFIDFAKQYDVPLRNEASRLKTKENQLYFQESKIRLTDFLYFNRGEPYHTIENVLQFLKYALEKYQCVEIGCHPGYSDDILRDIDILNDDREKELKVFMSKDIKMFIRENHISLITYSEL